jgi:translocation and assembly module TamB
MRRALKIILPVFGALLFIVAGLTITGVYIAQSDWLREKVRSAIVTEAERATGGKVEISKFRFDWKTLQAEIDGFTIHGTEPAGSPPLLTIRKLVVGLKIISLMERSVDILFARLESPRIYLLIAADGSTNVPSPKLPRKPREDPVQDILDLKIGNFSVLDGGAEVHAAGQPPKVSSYDASGKNLQSKLSYQALGAKYSGTLSVQPLDVRYDRYRTVQVGLDVTLAIDKDHLQIGSAKLSTASSHMNLSGELKGFTSPVINTAFNGAVSLPELGSILKLKSQLRGTVELDGDLRYTGNVDYRLSGKLKGKSLAYYDKTVKLANVSAACQFGVDPKAIELTNVTVGVLGGTVRGKATIRDLDRYQIAGTLAHFDIARLAPQPLPYDGIVEGPFELSGRLSDPNYRHVAASAQLAISPAPRGMPISGSISAKYDAANNQTVLAPSVITLPNSRLELNGVLEKRVQVVMESHDLGDLLPALAAAGEKDLPIALKDGSISWDGSIFDPLGSPRLEGHIAGKNFLYSGQLVDSLTGDVSAQQDGLTLRGAKLVYRNLNADFQGSVGLSKWKVSDASSLSGSANLQGASLPNLLALAGRKDIPVTGTLTIAGQVTGTVGNPLANATFNLVNGTIYTEPFDRITGKVESVNGGVESLSAQWRAGPRQVGLNARYQQSPNDFQTGTLNFQFTSNRMSLAQFAFVRKEWPGLAGTTYATGSGELVISKNGVRLTAINGDLETSNVTLDSLQLSDLKLTAQTEGGLVKAHLQSNLVHAEISADGSIQLTGDYPGTAQISFEKVDLATARKLLLPSPKGQSSWAFAGTVEGKATISGALLKPETLTAELEIPQFELRPDVSGVINTALSDVTIRNTQPIRAQLANSVIRVESARFTALNTDVSLLGTVNLKDKNPLSLNLNGTVDLKLARSFNPDLESSGSLLVRVTLRGSFDHPQLGGSADLRNGNISLAGFPNGLSQANGRITFDENRANIQSMTAQTGGGTIQLEGFAAFGGPSVTFRITGLAKGVRVRYPEGMSSVSDADLTWTGSAERSVLAGDVTIHKIAYNQQTDFAAVMAFTGAGPGPTQVAPTGLLGGTQFDVKVRTASDISFETGLVSGLQTEANLRLRGTAANPALLGRISISSGRIDFLGNKYVINQGTLSFFNPVRIEPIVNVDLSTQSRGVDVTFTISGPLTKLNLTYSSDPPLQFSDIVALLATGKPPTDPTIAARQTDTQQTWQQLGASALVGQAISNPVSGRLERFFGVSKIKIDPLLPGLGGAGASAGGSNPGARLSLEQQVAPNVTFDYVISTNSTSSQVVRVEWAFSRHWSAVILREENSAFGIDFQYKKRFK